ncbi:SAVED domain-containing protein [Streptomyces beijiangensis]|uniref:SAVED domain-containing protein n=1 Tax=Streptomyces beijiangensis TaxID=163361 RepID=A0A939JLI1_9ACTN|nr:SAVED domain-containing protein [Streptomyces beijiangensis]MBO0515764.1 SAVED domain-containing protein [Streptomyces beijiangensis]
MTRPAPRIELRQAAYEVMASATAQQLPREAGGILLGYQEDANVVVTHALVVDGQGASTHRYVRDDVKANTLLTEFLALRADDDPTGYVGEWHSHPAPSGPSPTDLAAMRAMAREHDGPIALLVYAPGGTDPFSGLIARRQRWGPVTGKTATVLPPPQRFKALGPLPKGAVRPDGAVFISYRQTDGSPQAESIENLLRAAGLVVWRDHTDLRAGTTTDRLEQALTQGLSAAVLVVTPDIVHSNIVRERELPRLLQLDEDPAFSLCIANKTASAGSDTRCDYDAPDRLLRLAPSRTLADKKQSNMLQPSGESEIVRDLLMHRVEQRKPAIRSQNRAFTIRVQTRPAPFAMDAGEDDLHIRIRAASDGRLPLREGLQRLQTTLPLTSDAVYAAGAQTVRVFGGAHLSVALALGAALPETKIGNVEVVDTRGARWTSVQRGDDPLTSELHTQSVDLEQAQSPDSHDRVAIFLSLTANPDQTAFEQLLHEYSDGFAAAAVISVAGEDRLDPREAARLSTAAAQQIKALAAHSGRAEVHLAFHGPYTMALLIGRCLNTLRTVVYEWDGAPPGKPRYTPALVLEPGVTSGPITEVLLDQ